MNLQLIKPPKAIRPPKIASVHIAKLPGSGGFKVSHVMDHAPTKNFSFQDPAKALSHINKINANRWKSPDSNIAASINRTMDTGPIS